MDSSKTSLFDRKLPRRIAGYLLSLMFAGGITSILVSMNRLDVDNSILLNAVVSTLLLLSVCFYNKVSAAISAVIAIALAVWFFVLSDNSIETTFNMASDFIAAITAMTRSGETPSYEHQVLFVRLLALAASLLAFITSSRLAGSVTLALSAAALFVAAWYLGYKDVFFELALCSATIAAVSAASFARKRAARERTALEDDKHREGRERAVYATGGTAGIALFIIPVLIALSLTLSLVVMPNLANDMRSRSIGTFVDDFLDFVGQYNPAYSRHMLSFSLNAAGFGDTGELGGPVELSQSVSMSVYCGTGQLYYLRGVSRTDYTGRGWKNNEAGGSYRFGAAIWNEREASVFDRSRPTAILGTRALTTRVRYTVTAFRHLGTLFMIQRPEEIISSIDKFSAYFNRRGDVYPNELLGFGMSYTVSGTQITYLSPSVTTYILNNEDKYPEDEAYMDGIHDTYLHGDTDYSSTLHYRTARDITARTGSKFAAALAIRSWLMNNFTYTLSPVPVPEGADFVDFFLQTGEGYCVYFASAMTLMARDIGIPARYVEGYLLTNAKQEDQTYTLTGENAHAWAELYFEGFGWIPFDATALGVAESTTSPSSPSTPGTTVPSEVIPSEEPPAVIEPSVPRPAERFNAAPIIWTLVALVLAFGAMVGGGYYVMWLYKPERLTPRLGKVAAAKVWWRETLLILPSFEPTAVRQPGETASMFAARLGDIPLAKSCSFETFTSYALLAYYSEEKLHDEHANAVYEFYKELRGRLARHLTPAGYLIWYLKRRHARKEQP